MVSMATVEIWVEQVTIAVSFKNNRKLAALWSFDHKEKLTFQGS